MKVAYRCYIITLILQYILTLGRYVAQEKHLCRLAIKKSGGGTRFIASCTKKQEKLHLVSILG